ncbi:PAS domain-containing sensor histidine kinase [Bradyrhizobium sp. UFLA03-84]|uniref:sensor histidine kinase n=1 Tax=Bradyrhizobium sp. UFLA03-84 TaxID=418599 RepID=UPI001FD8BE7A|nr:PAS domain-containing sensor histidine kinase [Bradyrhizobium sp. UFLA03-84]
MTAWLSGMFSDGNYLPHGLCLLWEPALVWLHVVSDGLIAASYYSIPAALMYFASKRQDLPFPGVFGLFAAFIMACGTTHLLGAVTLWQPLYWVDGAVKGATALVSVPTAVALWYLLPRALALPSPAQLETANRNLLREIEEHRKTELQLREANLLLDERVRARTALLQSILDTVPDAMVVIDASGIIESFSSTAERLFGYGADEVCGRNVAMLMPPSYSEEHDRYIERYIRTRERRIIGNVREVSGQRRDGTVFPMELSIGEVLHADRQLFTGFIRDLSERRRANDRLQELQTELIHVSRLSEMGQMATMVAHELNQPLTAITNYMNGGVRLLESEGDPRARLREAMERSAAQALRAGRIIKRLRDFVSRGEIERRFEPVSALIAEAAELASLGIRQKDLLIEVDHVAPDAAILADRIQLQQVLFNLLRNAAEAVAEQEQRSVAINARLDGSDVVISVIDNGPGISPEVQDRLFQPFVSTKENGMGVGLSICQAIIVAHDGRIWAEANPAGGTIFRIVLPRVQDTEKT